MKTTTKILHSLIQKTNTEEFFIQKADRNNFFYKFIPLHTSYTTPEKRTVKRDNSQFNLDISDYMQWHVWANLRDLSWLKGKEVKEGVVIDVGANIGAFTLKVLMNNRNKIQLHSFEPNPTVFEQLLNNSQLNPQITAQLKLNKIGLSNQEGFLDFYWSNLNSGGGSFTPNSKNLNVEKISVTTLDKYVEDNSIRNVTFIKIDVEGYEPFVLEGAINTIREFKPELFIEVSPEWWAKNGFDTNEVLTNLYDLGYKMFPVFEEIEQREYTLKELSKLNNQYNLYLKQK